MLRCPMELNNEDKIKNDLCEKEDSYVSKQINHSYVYVTCTYCGQQIGCRASNLKNLLDSLKRVGCPNPSCCSNGGIGEFIVES